MCETFTEICNRLNTFKYYNGTKKFDLNSIIGFALIFGILVFIMYQNQPDPKVVAAEKLKKSYRLKQQSQGYRSKIVEKQLLQQLEILHYHC
jgi:hypothetical protein